MEGSHDNTFLLLNIISTDYSFASDDFPGPPCHKTNGNHPYKRLDDSKQQIRLLKILPDSIGSEIRCETRVVELRDAPPYMALSYTWGSLASAIHPIELDGQAFNIRTNLWHFFQEVGKTSPRLPEMWIDAICINQGDNCERSSQVSLMPKIYNGAETVRIWLGQSHHYSDNIMKRLRALKSPEVINSRFLNSLLDRHEQLPTGFAIACLCARPYWQRLWVFQELMLARHIEIMCGSIVVEGALFERLISEISKVSFKPRFQEKPVYKYVRGSTAMRIFNRRGQDWSQHSLWELLGLTHSLKCNDPRDKVYALLGVARQGKSELKADYSLPVPVLLNRLLRAHHRCQKPNSVQEVEDQCEWLAKLFKLDTEMCFTFDGAHESFLVPSKPELVDFPLQSRLEPESPVTLWWANAHDHSEVSRLLLQDDIEADKELLKAATCGHAAVVKVLIDASVDVHALDKKERTPLHCAAQQGHIPVAQLLLRKERTLLGSLDQSQQTPLHLAARQGHESMVKLLLRGSDISSRDAEGQMPLHYAALQGHGDIIRLLLRAGGAHVNERTNKQWSALHMAACKGHVDATNALLWSEADTGLETPAGETALSLARRKGHVKVVRLLEDDDDF